MSEVQYYDGYGNALNENDPAAVRKFVDAGDYDALAAECERLRSEVSDMHTTMMAAAVEIHEHWDAHCDAEGYGPANLMHRLERGISSQYGYDAETVVRLEAERDAALAELAALKGGRELRYQFDGAVIRTEHGVWVGELIAYDDDLLSELISAPPAQASAWVAEGWKLVPIQMTDEMRDAGNIYTLNRGTLVSIWADMLAAAPTPGASDGKGGDV